MARRVEADHRAGEVVPAVFADLLRGRACVSAARRAPAAAAAPPAPTANVYDVSSADTSSDDRRRRGAARGRRSPTRRRCGSTAPPRGAPALLRRPPGRSGSASLARTVSPASSFACARRELQRRAAADAEVPLPLHDRGGRRHVVQRDRRAGQAQEPGARRQRERRPAFGLRTKFHAGVSAG